jgi:hypothetical protein
MGVPNAGVARREDTVLEIRDQIRYRDTIVDYDA